MNSTQLAYRLLNHCDPSEISALNLSQKMELSGVINRSLVALFAKAPTIFNRTSISTEMQGPEDIHGLTITKGMTDLSSGTPFGDAYRGCSIYISGDPNRNELVSTSGWLNPYQGDDPNPVVTIHHDCVSFDESFVQRITSDPWIDGSYNGWLESRLLRVSTDHDIDRYWHNLWGAPGSWGGTPRRYAIEHTGISIGAQQRFQLRISPSPQRPLILRFEVDALPAVSAHLIGCQSIDLPGAEQYHESILYPLAMRELISTTLFNESLHARQIPRIAENARRAEDLIRVLPTNFGCPSHRGGTRKGW